MFLTCMYYKIICATKYIFTRVNKNTKTECLFFIIMSFLKVITNRFTHAPTLILLICEVSVYLMKVFFSLPELKNKLFVTNELGYVQSMTSDDVCTVCNRNTRSFNHELSLCLSSYNLNDTVPLNIL